MSHKQPTNLAFAIRAIEMDMENPFAFDHDIPAHAPPASANADS